MPIPVQCAGCQTQMNAPDSAAGKQVKCPNCQALVAVPDTVAAAPAKRSGTAPRPVAKPAAPPPEPLGLDDDEPVEEKPARKSGATPKPAARKRRDDDDDGRGGGKSFRERRAAAAGGPPAALVLVVAGLVGLGIVGGVLYTGYALFLSGKDDTRAAAGGSGKSGGGSGSSGGGSGSSGNPGIGKAGGGKAAVPAGWKEFVSKDGGFKAYIPGDPVVDSPHAELAPVRKGGKSPINGGRMVLALGPNEEANIVAFGVRFEVTSAQDRDRAIEQLVSFLKEGGRGVRGVERGRRDITWLGQKAKEIIIRFPPSGPKAEQDMVVRTAVVGSYGYVAAIGGKSGRPRPEDENGFFDNFEALK
jgi:hypothetical protein